jgi:multiple antibiotic resistance protein
MPLIAGPGSMSAIVLLMVDVEGVPLEQAAVLVGLVLVLLLTLVSMLLANQLQKVLGIIGMHVIARVFGVLLTALAVQFIFDGVAQSGLLTSVPAL